MTKKFKISKQEKMHFDSLTYTMDYLEQSAKQFISAIITERLGERPDPKKSVEWKLDGNDLILEITDIEEPDFFVAEPSKQ